MELNKDLLEKSKTHIEFINNWITDELTQKQELNEKLELVLDLLIKIKGIIKWENSANLLTIPSPLFSSSPECVYNQDVADCTNRRKDKKEAMNYISNICASQDLLDNNLIDLATPTQLKNLDLKMKPKNLFQEPTTSTNLSDLDKNLIDKMTPKQLIHRNKVLTPSSSIPKRYVPYISNSLRKSAISNSCNSKVDNITDLSSKRSLESQSLIYPSTIVSETPKDNLTKTYYILEEFCNDTFTEIAQIANNAKDLLYKLKNNSVNLINLDSPVQLSKKKSSKKTIENGQSSISKNAMSPKRVLSHIESSDRLTSRPIKVAEKRRSSTPIQYKLNSRKDFSVLRRYNHLEKLVTITDTPKLCSEEGASNVLLYPQVSKKLTLPLGKVTTEELSETLLPLKKHSYSKNGVALLRRYSFSEESLSTTKNQNLCPEDVPSSVLPHPKVSNRLASTSGKVTTKRPSVSSLSLKRKIPSKEDSALSKRYSFSEKLLSTTQNLCSEKASSIISPNLKNFDKLTSHLGKVTMRRRTATSLSLKSKLHIKKDEAISRRFSLSEESLNARETPNFFSGEAILPSIESHLEPNMSILSK